MFILKNVLQPETFRFAVPELLSTFLFAYVFLLLTFFYALAYNGSAKTIAVEPLRVYLYIGITSLCL